MGSLFESSAESGPRLRSDWVNAVLIPKIFHDVDSFFHENDIFEIDPTFLLIVLHLFSARSMGQDQLMKNIQQLLVFLFDDDVDMPLPISTLSSLLCSTYVSCKHERIIVQLRFHDSLAMKFRTVFDSAPLVQNGISMARVPYVDKFTRLSNNMIAVVERQTRGNKASLVGWDTRTPRANTKTRPGPFLRKQY